MPSMVSNLIINHQVEAQHPPEHPESLELPPPPGPPLHLVFLFTSPYDNPLFHDNYLSTL